jgi:hypothetical protein
LVGKSNKEFNERNIIAMGRIKRLLEDDWYEYSQSINLHWMEEEFYYKPKPDDYDNNIRQQDLEQE